MEGKFDVKILREAGEDLRRAREIYKELGDEKQEAAGYYQGGNLWRMGWRSVGEKVRIF